MNRYKIALPFIFIIALFFSCRSDSDTLLQQARGDSNDVIVVMSEQYWNNKPGELLRDKFNKPVIALPQDEPTFDILHVPHKLFDKVYKRQRNIVVVQIGPNYKKNITVQSNVWAKPQVVVSIMAHTKDEFEAFLPKVLDKMVEIIQDKERERLLKAYKSSPNTKITERLNNKHQVNLTVPKGYNIALDTSNFIWLHSSYRDIQEGIFLYYYPYKDSNTFSKDYIINKRNYYLKKYIEGKIHGSYMSTEERFPISFNEFSMNGSTYTAEIRGLWNMKEGTAMGGPFVSITQYDEERQRIITAEGFIFAPGENKRNLLRRVETIIYSLESHLEEKNKLPSP